MNEFDGLDLGATIRTLVAGQCVFKRFQLVRILGRGGMGIVWLAHDEKLEEEVALKFLPDTVRLDSGAVDQLKQETRKSRRLTHQNIVRIHDYIDDEETAALSMEFVDGQTLAVLRLQQPGKIFEPENLKAWIGPLCKALDFAHGTARLVHRDLKPVNIMVTKEGILKIADFGISCSIADSLHRISVLPGSSGTPPYMSPQQASGQPSSPLDDIYSVGATIYELLTGKPPFFSGNIHHQVENIVPPPMSVRRQELGVQGNPIPAEWERTVASCLAKDPAQRPQSAGEIAERLELVPGSPLRSVPLGAEPDRVQPSRAGALWKVALAVLIAGGLLAGWWWGLEKPRRENPREASREIANLFALADEAGRRKDHLAEREIIERIKTIDPENSRVKAALDILESMKGEVKVEVHPSGASVQLDALGKKSASPIAVFTGLPLGLHIARISYPGYEPQDREFTVRNGEELDPAPVNLHRLTGTLTIGFSPGTTCTLALKNSEAGLSDELVLSGDDFPLAQPSKLSDNVYQWQWPQELSDRKDFQIRNLPTGTYEMSFSREGWPEQRLPVTVENAGLASVNATWKTASADFSSVPPGARVFLIRDKAFDSRPAPGDMIGTTPFRRDGLQAGSDRTFVFQSDGYSPCAVKAILTTEQIGQVSAELVRPFYAYRGVIHVKGEEGRPGTPLRLKFDSGFQSGSIEQTGRSGSVIVKFHGDWQGAVLSARTGDIISKPHDIEWEPENFTVSITSKTKGAYTCEASGKTYFADLTPE